MLRETGLIQKIRALSKAEGYREHVGELLAAQGVGVELDSWDCLGVVVWAVIQAAADRGAKLPMPRRRGVRRGA